MPSLRHFSDILHHLPEESGLHDQAEDWATDWVLLWEGDTTLPTLDLDDPGAGLGPDMVPPGPLVLVLVTGSLVVQGNVFSTGTASSTSLAVLGDLSAENLMAGGQNLLVTGDVKIQGLFWGDDDQGGIEVAGDVLVRLWLITRGYSVQVDGRFQAGDIWDDESIGHPAPAACRAALEFYFDPELIVDGSFDDLEDIPSWLDRAQMHQRLATRRAVLRAVAPILARPERLASSELNLENLQLLATTPLASEADENGRIIWNDEAGTYCRLNPLTLDPAFPGMLYFETPQRRYLLTVVLPKPQGFWSRLAGRGGNSSAKLKVETRIESDEVLEWDVLSAEAVAEDATLQALWADWLPRIAEAENQWSLLKQEITVEQVESLLALPYARTAFASEDDGCHFGGDYLALRQREEGVPRVVQGWHGSVENDDDGDPDSCYAQFAVETDGAGQRKVQVYFQPAMIRTTIAWSALRFPHRLAAIRTRFRVCQEILRLGQEDLERSAQLLAERRRAVTVPEPGWLELTLNPPADSEDPPVVQRFRLATPASLDEELGALSFDGKPAVTLVGDPEAGSLVLVVDGDCALPCLELSAVVGEIPIAGYLFRGDLSIDYYLLAPQFGPVPALIVKGRLDCPDLHLRGGLNFVGGDLGSGCVYGSGPGHLTVAGLLESFLLVAQNFDVVSGRLNVDALVADREARSFNTVLLPSGEAQKKLDLFPPTARSGDLFADDLCDPMPSADGHSFPDCAKLHAHMQATDSFYDADRLAALYDELTEAEAARLFDWVFASPRLATGNYAVHQGETYDGDDHAFARRDAAGNRFIGLHRSGAQSYEVCLHMDPQGAITAEHYVLPGAGFPDTVLFGEPVASRRLSPMAAKHGFYCALEQMAFLPYRQPLPPDAPVESALSVAADLQRIQDAIHWVDDGQQLTAVEAAHLKRALHALKPKIEALCPPDAPELTRWLEWTVLVLVRAFRNREQVLQAVSLILSRVDAHGHSLRDPLRFLEAMLEAIKQRGIEDEDAPFVLQLQADAIRLLGPVAGMNRIFDLRRAYGYLLHQAGRWAEALACNQALLADVDAQQAVDANKLCALLINLAQNVYELGQPEESRAYLLRTLELAEAQGNAWATDEALFQLGVLSFEGGDPLQGKTYFERRLSHARAQNDKEMISEAEESLAEWQARMDEPV